MAGSPPPGPGAPAPGDDHGGLLRLLATGSLEVLGRMPWSSNGTFLVEVCGAGDERCQAVYKPGRGERPLWDFPHGLYRREVAAYRLSAALGWHLVPPTVLRDGPLGEGSLQWFVDADFDQHYFTLYEDTSHHAALQAICAFDLLANNTDRKSGHCLIDGDARIWGIDNGLCFAVEDKLRTVIWEFAGEPVPAPLRPAIESLSHRLPTDVAALLDADEQEALSLRARALAQRPVFPTDPGGRRYPWPLV